jgi:hypothetical protein
MDPPPPGDQQVVPDVVGVIGEAIAEFLQADLVVIDRAGGDHPEPLFGERQPVPRCDLLVEVKGQVLLNKATQCIHAELGLPALELQRQSGAHTFSYRGNVVGA